MGYNIYKIIDEDVNEFVNELMEQPDYFPDETIVYDSPSDEDRKQMTARMEIERRKDAKQLRIILEDDL